MTDRMGAGMSKFIGVEVCSALSENIIKVFTSCYCVSKRCLRMSSGKVEVVTS